MGCLLLFDDWVTLLFLHFNLHGESFRSPMLRLTQPCPKHPTAALPIIDKYKMQGPSPSTFSRMYVVCETRINNDIGKSGRAIDHWVSGILGESTTAKQAIKFTQRRWSRYFMFGLVAGAETKGSISSLGVWCRVLYWVLFVLNDNNNSGSNCCNPLEWWGQIGGDDEGGQGQVGLGQWLCRYRDFAVEGTLTHLLRQKCAQIDPQTPKIARLLLSVTKYCTRGTALPTKLGDDHGGRSYDQHLLLICHCRHGHRHINRHNHNRLFCLYCCRVRVDFCLASPLLLPLFLLHCLHRRCWCCLPTPSQLSPTPQLLPLLLPSSTATTNTSCFAAVTASFLCPQPTANVFAAATAATASIPSPMRRCLSSPRSNDMKKTYFFKGPTY